MQQFNPFRNNRPHQSRRKSLDPVLTAEDEAFLRNVTSESPAREPGQPGESIGDQQLTTAHPVDADTQPPLSPAEEFGRQLGEEELRARSAAQETASGNATSAVKAESSATQAKPQEKKKRSWSWMWKKADKKDHENPKQAPATSADQEAKQETEDMTEILERLNLAADNDRVFSVGDETQELLRKFKLIFKDLINGVPTAYHDLEMLLTNGNRQLQETYTQLPGFLQKLIEKLPERWTESLAPEILAVAAERASQSGLNVDNIGKAAAAANKMGITVPSLKELVGKPAAIVGMLRSIMTFLRARFPAVLGMNVLWSLALFILLFVLWYCHKRGREVRLENERLVTEEEIGKMNEEASDATTQIRNTETLTTTAPRGASAAEVREGIRDAQRSRNAIVEADEGKQEEPTPEVKNGPVKPTRTKSVLSIFGRSNNHHSTPKVEPYPGT